MINEHATDLPDTESDFELRLDPSKPLVLLLGWVDHEGILSTLKSNGQQYKKKLLNSTPRNWESIVKLFIDFNITAVVGKLPPHVLALITDKAYFDVSKRLFTAIGTIPNKIFMFEDMIMGKQQDSFYAEYMPYPSSEVIDKAIDFLKVHNVQILPYKTSAEVTVLTEQFFDEINKNLILRVYIPKGRLWAAEADRFLQLFQDYLERIERLEVRLDQKRTEHGTVYEFHGQISGGQNGLVKVFQEFSQIMSLFDVDQNEAAKLLTEKGSNTQQISTVITKYSKEVKRLRLDIKQEAEQKILSTLHRLESELTDIDLPCKEIEQIQNQLSSMFFNRIGLLSNIFMTSSVAHPLTQNQPPIIYNINNQFNNAVNTIVTEEFNGNAHFQKEHHELMKLISSYGEDRSEELKTAVYEIADSGTDKGNKLDAGNKLKRFLCELAKSGRNIAAGVLQTFIENQIGL